MVASTHIQSTNPTLSEHPIDWRMDFKLCNGSDNEYSPGGFGSTNINGPLRLRLSQPRDDAVGASATGQLVGELLQRINDLQARIECLEDRLPSPHDDMRAFDPNEEPQPTLDAFDELNDGASAQPSPVERENCCGRLDDLPRGPLSIDVVAKALCKTVRTIRGWCQVEKYGIPTHKEAGYWRFYRDELMVWYADYEAISRRNAKRAQAKRRKTKHGKQEL